MSESPAVPAAATRNIEVSVEIAAPAQAVWRSYGFRLTEWKKSDAK